METIHILKGTGDNCSCYDCAVLYGGTCGTTEINNMLDKLEKDLEKYLSFTKTGRKKKQSAYAIDSSIEKIIKPVFTKHLKLKKLEFYEKYYSFLPLIYCMTSDKKSYDEQFYKIGRMMLFNDIEKNYLPKKS